MGEPALDQRLIDVGVAVARADSVERARVKANKVIAAIKVEL